MLCSEYLGERLECGGQRADEDHCVCVRAVSVGRGIRCTLMEVRGKLSGLDYLWGDLGTELRLSGLHSIHFYQRHHHSSPS